MGAPRAASLPAGSAGAGASGALRPSGALAQAFAEASSCGAGPEAGRAMPHDAPGEEWPALAGVLADLLHSAGVPPPFPAAEAPLPNDGGGGGGGGDGGGAAWEALLASGAPPPLPY
jgi:hypothetical protein